VLRASNMSWEGDRYLRLEVKTRFSGQVLVEKPIVATGSHESGPIVRRDLDISVQNSSEITLFGAWRLVLG
jgi:hypothetical protein